jgi:hypothetical protein
MAPVTIYEQTDIPPGMTCDEYKQLRPGSAHRHRLRLLRLRAFLRW